MLAVSPPVMPHHMSRDHQPTPAPLPTELILDIISQPTTTNGLPAPHLLRVSPWIQQTLTPKLYNTVVLSSWTRIDQFKNAVSTGKNEKNVRKLSFGDIGEYPIWPILRRCTSIQSLMMATANARTTDMSHLTSVKSLTLTGAPYFLHPNSKLPPNVTHLHLVDNAPISSNAVGAILTLSNLTHLAFKLTGHILPFQPDPTPRLLEVLANILHSQNGKIEKIVIYITSDADPRYKTPLSQYAAKDARIAILTDVDEDWDESSNWFSIESWTEAGGEWSVWRQLD